MNGTDYMPLTLWSYRKVIRELFVDGNSIKEKFFGLINEYPIVPVHKMGFPLNWKTQPIWIKQ